jgi:hypothetical protein
MGVLRKIPAGEPVAKKCHASYPEKTDNNCQRVIEIRPLTNEHAPPSQDCEKATHGHQPVADQPPRRCIPGRSLGFYVFCGSALIFDLHGYIPS